MPTVPELNPDAPKVSMLTDQMNQVKQRQQQDFVGTLQAVSKVNPDQFAKATQVERWSGVPADVLHKHQEKADALLASRKYENIYADYAKTAKALADGKIAALAHDDIDNIARVEDAVKAVRFNAQSESEKLINSFRSGWAARNESVNSVQADNQMQIGKYFDAIDAEIARASAAGEQPFNGGSAPGQGFGFEYLNATPEQKAVMRSNLGAAVTDSLGAVAENEKIIQSLPVDPADTRAQRLVEGGMSSAEARFQSRMEQPGSLVRMIGQSLPAMTDMLVGGIVGGIPGAAIGEYGSEYGGKLTEILRESKVNLADPKAVLQFLQDDEAMADARGRSQRKALGTTAVDTLSFGLASKMLAPAAMFGKPLSATAREGINIGAQIVPQGLLGAASDAVGQYAADGKVDGGDVVDEGLIQGVFSLPEILMFGGKRIKHNISDGLRKSRNAKVGKAGLDQMVEAVEGGKLKGRDLESFKSVTEQQLKGSDIETVWIPAAKLQELNQSGIAILPELLKQVPGLGEQFAEASARGGSVQLKTSDYLAHFGGFHDQLGDYVRLQADGLSVDEIKGWEDEQVAQLEQMAQSMKEAADPKSVVYQDAIGQLIAAGWQQQDAAQVASLRTAMITKLSKSTGLSVDELMARDPLNIRKQAPEQLQRIPVTEMGLMLDRLRTGDVPKPADMFGKSLMEQLNADGGLQDDGGELAALDANVGKVGRNRITRPDGKTLDHAAMWAWERGYFPGVDQKDVGPDLIVNALREEMAGKPRYSVAQENATLRDQADALNALQDHLDQIGVDLSQLDNAQVAELLSKPQGEQAYSQDGKKPETIYIDSMTGDGTTKVLKNPTRNQALAFSKAAKYESLRGIVDPETGDLYIADSHTVDHKMLAEGVGLDWDGVRYSTDPDTGSSNRLSIPAKAIEFYPRNIFSDDNRQTYNQSGQLKTDTANFKRWFGDSKVVDADGKPLVVYHVTSAEFDTFNDERPIFVAFDERGASVAASGSGKTMSLYVRAERPVNTIDSPVHFLDVSKTLRSNPDADSVYVSDEAGVSLALRSNKQIKSAIGNNGNYDPNDASILHQSAAGAKALAGIKQEWDEAGIDYSLMERGDVVTVSKIVVPKDARESGAGTKAMTQLVEWADANGKHLALTPDSAFGGNKKRLKEFYKRFGFVENKGKNTAFTVSETMVRQAPGKVLYQPDGGMGSPDDNRGSITFGPRQDGVREFNINLGPKSDLSTVLHELGHYYLEVIGGLVDDGKANAELAGDYAAIRKWLGAADGEPLHVDQHEQFARGFEKYLAEGKAPSIELQGAFARFKRWMVAIYKDLSRLNVELTDEVRSVFDRLLASQEEIDAAMQVSQAMPMFESAEKAGMSESEWADYQTRLVIARDDAESDIERQIRAEEERKQSKWWNDQLARIRKEVGEEVDLVPAYKAMKALRAGQLEGVAATFKLQSGEINERYGKRVLQKLAFMHAKQGGIPMDIAASMLGFKSGDEMVKTMLETPSRAAAIEQEAQARMLERHGNKVTGEAADAAMAAVHNDRRADVLRMELEALAKQGSRKRITSQQILKEAAKRIMQQRKVREIAPHEYQRAEAKAGREAFAAVANGDLEAAYEAKQRQLLNFHLYREAVKAREQVAKITERMKGYNKTSRRQKIGKAGHDYLDQIDAVMEQYEFRNVSLRELDKRVSFGQWYNDQVAAGNDPYVPEFILKSMGKTNYKDLSLDQLQELDEFTKHVEHLARFKNKLLANDRIATKEEATNMLVDGAYANMEQLGRELIDKNARDVSEETRDYLREGNSSLMKVEQVIDWLDGGKTDGNWTQVFWRPLAEAQHKRDDLNRAVTQKVNAAIKEWFDTLGKDAGAKIHIKGTNQPMTRNGVLAVALNQGNAGNKAKLLKGYGWDQSVVDEILGHMTKADWQLVNNLWEIVGSLWPEIAAMEKQANGIAPAAVEHTPVETPFGVLAGGYWPLVYDTMSDAYANVLKDMGTLAPLSEQGQVRAATPRGHTKARVDGFAAPIVLDVSIIGHHLAGVVHDLTHRLPLADARSLLTTPSVVSALNKTIGKPMTAQFRNMVDGIAADLAPGSQKGIGVIQRGMNILRSNQAVAWMGYSVTTAINQIGGYGQGMEYFAQKGARKHYLKALAKFAANPIAQMEMARTMSGEMRNRDINLDQTLREATGQMIQVKDGHLIMDAWKGVKAGRDALVKYSFVPLQYVQRMVDVPVWMAAYELEGGALNHDIAVQAADKAVRLTQMAGGAKDLSSVQHSDLLRFFLPVYGYASLLWNRNVDIARVAKQGIKQRNAKQVLLAFERFIYLNILPAMLAAAIKGDLPDEEDDETWAAWVAVNSLLSVTNGVPLMRDIAAGAFSDFGYGGASQIGAGFGNLLKATNASSAESITTNMVSAAGQLFGLPASQINRSVRTAFALEDGEMEESADAIIRGILFGPPRD